VFRDIATGRGWLGEDDLRYCQGEQSHLSPIVFAFLGRSSSQHAI
jgi:hypothetical protein